MDAVNSCSTGSLGPPPIGPEATPSASQQTVSAQRQLHWHQPYQGEATGPIEYFRKYKNLAILIINAYVVNTKIFQPKNTCSEH